MKRFFLLAALLLSAFPVGMSIGCASNPNNYCPGTGNTVHVGPVTAITLPPANSAISLAYGQTRQLGSPSAVNCLNTAVSVSSFTYGTSKPGLLDISPTGNMCAGTWEKNVGGTTSDYTICDAPSASAIPSNPANSYSYVTASAQSVTSNQVPVFVHAPATSASLYAAGSDGTCGTAPTSCGTTAQVANQCVSQAQSATYCTQVCSGTDDISLAVGPVAFTAQNAAQATFSTPNFSTQVLPATAPSTTTATGAQPGATALSANISGVSVSGGVFATCPVAAIALQIQNTDGSLSTSITLPVNNTRQLVPTAIDSAGVVLTNVPLTYTSTTPQTLPVTTTGGITPVFAGAGDIYVSCLPPLCNPSPATNLIGQYGTPITPTSKDIATGVGQPIVSNAVSVTTPGLVAATVYGVNYTQPVMGIVYTGSGAPSSSSVRLPYTPNSAAIRRDGGVIVLGSSQELMFFNPASNGISAQDNNVSGNVLAINPNGTTLIFTNVAQQLIYVYSIPSTLTGYVRGSYLTFGGVGTKAEFTPDGTTVYIDGYRTNGGVQQPIRFIYNAQTGLTQDPTTGTLNDVAVLTPPVGAFFGQNDATTTVGYCSAVTGDTVVPFAPPADDVVGQAAQALGATNDGSRVLTADGNSYQDVFVSIPPQTSPTATMPATVPAACNGAPYDITGAPQSPIAMAIPADVTDTYVVPTPDSTAAVVTYTGDTGSLPAFVLSSSSATPDMQQTVPLANNATAPISAVSSPDSSTFFVGTTGDNAIHLISVSAIKACANGATTCAADTAQASTGIVDGAGNTYPAQYLMVRATKSLQE